MSHLDDSAKKLDSIRQECAGRHFTNQEHYGFLLECLIMQIAGLRDAIEAKKAGDSAQARQTLDSRLKLLEDWRQTIIRESVRLDDRLSNMNTRLWALEQGCEQ